MKPEPLPLIRNRHYAQGSVARARREQRMERRRRGEVGLPERRWKKSHGTYAKLRKTPWSPFDGDGNVDWERLQAEGFTKVGALVDDELAQFPKTQEASATVVLPAKVDIASWMDEQAEKVLGDDEVAS